MKRLSIATIGLGFAGSFFNLCAKKLLQKKFSLDLHIFEKFQTPSNVGSGICMQPLGLTYLHKYDPKMCKRILNYGTRIDNLEIHAKQKLIMDLKYQNLHPQLYGLGLQRLTLFEEFFNELKRNDDIQLHFGNEIIRVHTIGDKIYLFDALDRQYGPFDLVIVSDGSRSKLRDYLTQIGQIESKTTPFDWSCLWTLINEDPNRSHRNTLFQNLKSCNKMIGYMPSGSSMQDSTRKCSFFYSIHKNDYEKWKRNEISLEDMKQDVRDIDPTYSQFVLDQISLKSQLQFASYQDVKTKRIGSQNIVLMGDASHATSPVLGQGTNLALADSYLLASALLQQDTFESSFKQFEKETDHVWFIRRASRLLNPVFQSNIPFLSFFRDTFSPIVFKSKWIYKQALLTQSGMKNGILSNYNVKDYLDPYQ